MVDAKEEIEMYNVYAIKSLARNYVYVGLTDNLVERLKRHNSGGNKTMAPYAPFELIFQEECANRKSARLREKYLKSGIGKEFLKSICN
ncbi:MAG: GIY-YIG nuclease family protein [Melioribacteraceae bacterium]